MKTHILVILFALMGAACNKTAMNSGRSMTIAPTEQPLKLDHLVGSGFDLEFTYDDTATTFWQTWVGTMRVSFDAPQAGHAAYKGRVELGAGWDGLDEECFGDARHTWTYNETTGDLEVTVVIEPTVPGTNTVLVLRGRAVRGYDSVYISSDAETRDKLEDATWEVTQVSNLCGPDDFLGGLSGLLEGTLTEDPQARESMELVQTGAVYKVAADGTITKVAPVFSVVQ